jgi:LytS/YehU family sensor histidine kinase
MDENGTKPQLTLAEEIDHVRSHLENEEFRYNGRLSTSLQVDPEVDLDLIIPRRLIHVFVMNALRHNLFQNNNGGHIDIAIHKSNLGVLILVSDTGSCLHVEPDGAPVRSNELRLLDSYLPLFNNQHDHQVSYDIVDLEHYKPGETGTRALITIKI